MEPSIKAKAQRAFVRFLTHKGYEIRESGWSCGNDTIDFIVKDPSKSTLVFISCQACINCEKGFPEEVNDRQKLERIAIDYLKNHETDDCQIRFDTLALLALGENRAFLRHHINALGCFN